MSDEWNVGDLAMVKCADDKWRLAKKDVYATVPIWRFMDGLIRNQSDSESRPVVVIDPEDREAVERLGDALLSNGVLAKFGLTPGNVAAALREFANPKPSKPDEPLGLGAVVEDADGSRWVRTYGKPRMPDSESDHWKNENFVTRHRWSEVAAVRVLSEGVTS